MNHLDKIVHVALHTFHIFFIFFIEEDIKTEPGDEEYFVKLKLIHKQLLLGKEINILILRNFTKSSI